MEKSARTLIVTGASRGIGAATAILAAKQGYAVAVNYRTERARADEVVARIKAGGGKAVAIAGDVADEKDVIALFDAAERAFGPIGALVNNAGITGPVGRVENLERKTLELLLAVNVTGAVLSAREAVRRMSTTRGGAGGAIVNVASRASELGAPGTWVPYALTKGAIDTFTRGLAYEVAREGIRVNAVSPGLIDTEIHGPAGGAERLKKLGPGVPMGRPGTAEEVAEAAVWLLSPAASYITGAILPVSGGR